MRANNSYFTSPHLAALLWDVTLRYVQPRTVLEPCAGDGALVRVGRARGVRVDGVEIDAQLCDAHGWEHADFLLKEPTAYDAVICNPPFSEIRQQGQNNSNGKDFALSFLVHAAKFAPYLGFIMHQQKGTLTFAEKLLKLEPRLRCIHRECAPKTMSVFTVDGKSKFVPTSVYVYATTDRFPSVVNIPVWRHESPDFVLLRPSDESCNLLVKRWGSRNRVGRAVSTDASIIKEQVSKPHGTNAIISAPNFHLACADLARVQTVLLKMVPLLERHFEYAQHASNVTMRPEEFYTLYAAAAAAL
jgi:hypothetical protein